MLTGSPYTVQFAKQYRAEQITAENRHRFAVMAKSKKTPRTGSVSVALDRLLHVRFARHSW